MRYGRHERPNNSKEVRRYPGLRFQVGGESKSKGLRSDPHPVIPTEAPSERTSEGSRRQDRRSEASGQTMCRGGAQDPLERGNGGELKQRKENSGQKVPHKEEEPLEEVAFLFSPSVRRKAGRFGRNRHDTHYDDGRKEDIYLYVDRRMFPVDVCDTGEEDIVRQQRFVR